MAFVEHFAGYMAEFGELVTIGGTATGTAIVHLPQVTLGDLIVEDLRLEGETASLEDAEQGVEVVVRGVSYTVRSNQPDGSGWSVVALTLP